MSGAVKCLTIHSCRAHELRLGGLRSSLIEWTDWSPLQWHLCAKIIRVHKQDTSVEREIKYPRFLIHIMGLSHMPVPLLPSCWPYQFYDPTGRVHNGTSAPKYPESIE